MLTLDQIRPYLQLGDGGTAPAGLLHGYYKKTITYRDELAKVFSAKYPDYLSHNRPRERKQDRAYRQLIYKNPFKHLPKRVSATLDYIHQADDFGITFRNLPEGIDEEDSLQKYTGESFTPDGSLKDWFFNNVVDTYLFDPNAAGAMVLQDIPGTNVAENFSEKGFYSPKPVVFPCENVWMHQKGRFAVLLDPERHPEFVTKSPDGKQIGGRMIHFFDDESYTVAFEVQVSKVGDTGNVDRDWIILGTSRELVQDIDGNFAELVSFTPLMHGFSNMPVFKLGKIREEYNAQREEYYVSFLDGAIPKIKEAQQIQNDVELERTFHVTSTEWRRKSALPKCSHPDCVGGTVTKREMVDNQLTLVKVKCPTCDGKGLNPSSGSALEMLLVNDDIDPKSFGANDARPQEKGAPGGYIEKSIEPKKELSADLKVVTDEVYEVINMRFIRNTPNEASGTSKRYDREELYRELNTQAAHLLQLLTNYFAQADHSRYANYPSIVGQQTPEIMVPVRFNLENAELTREELNDAKDKDYDPSISSLLELKLLEYNAGTKSTEYNQYQTRLKLDPFRAMNSDEKNMIVGLTMMIMKDGNQKNAAVKEFYFSILFDSLLIKAELEHEEFYEKTMKERHDILRGYMGEFYSELKEIEMQTDPLTGMPKMVQTSVKPPVNVQDINQTDKNKKTIAAFGGGK